MKQLFEEFKEFIDRGDVVTTAVGLVMALYFKAIVDQLIDGVITPVLAAVIGKSDIAAVGFHLGDSFVSIGLVVTAVIDFLVVAAVLFVVVKLHRSRRTSEPEAAAPTGPSEIDLLTEIRDSLRTR